MQKLFTLYNRIGGREKSLPLNFFVEYILETVSQNRKSIEFGKQKWYNNYAR